MADVHLEGLVGKYTNVLPVSLFPSIFYHRLSCTQSHRGLMPWRRTRCSLGTSPVHHTAGTPAKTHTRTYVSALPLCVFGRRGGEAGVPAENHTDKKRTKSTQNGEFRSWNPTASVASPSWLNTFSIINAFIHVECTCQWFSIIF